MHECCVRFGSQENPSSQPLLLAALRSEAASAWPDCHSGVKLKRTLYKCLLHSCLKLSSSLQMQGVVVVALSRQRELQAQCAASASCSSAEAASSVLSTSLESWIARVGRANSSTRHEERHHCMQEAQTYMDLKSSRHVSRTQIFPGKMSAHPNPHVLFSSRGISTSAKNVHFKRRHEIIYQRPPEEAHTNGKGSSKWAWKC